MPPQGHADPQGQPGPPYDLVARYPDAARSRRYGWGIFPRLPFRNPGFTTSARHPAHLLMLAMAGASANRPTAPISGCSASRWW